MIISALTYIFVVYTELAYLHPFFILHVSLSNSSSTWRRMPGGPHLPRGIRPLPTTTSDVCLNIFVHLVREQPVAHATSFVYWLNAPSSWAHKPKPEPEPEPLGKRILADIYSVIANPSPSKSLNVVCSVQDVKLMRKKLCIPKRKRREHSRLVLFSRVSSESKTKQLIIHLEWHGQPR